MAEDAVALLMVAGEMFPLHQEIPDEEVFLLMGGGGQATQMADGGALLRPQEIHEEEVFLLMDEDEVRRLTRAIPEDVVFSSMVGDERL
jgi:hypothetical protein